MARKKSRLTPVNSAVDPEVGVRVTVLCRAVSFRGGDRRVGKVVATGQGLQGDMFIVEFDAGYRETFREIDLRIGEAQLFAA